MIIYKIRLCIGMKLQLCNSIMKYVTLPNKSSLISLAACIPSSFRFFSICFERARAARSSADMAQPMAPQICVSVVMVRREMVANFKYIDVSDRLIIRDLEIENKYYIGFNTILNSFAYSITPISFLFHTD